ncbi:MAG: putative rane protein [Firmicutes bacterium]|nr:putative rane protein [Bacillota bacterium]
MQKIIAVMITLILSLTCFVSVYAAEIKSIDTMMSEIRIEQGVKDNKQINPNRVSQTKLEELGDSVMEAMIGNSEVHEQMDLRHGGEGSASLTALHIRIGYNYLVGYPDGMMTLMSSGMMSSNKPWNANRSNGWDGMMGYSGYHGVIGYLGWGGMIIGLLIMIIFIVILILIIRRLVRKPLNASIETPLDILKRRYALGEITKDDFERMKGDLSK